jgi:hypothetical protein
MAKVYYGSGITSIIGSIGGLTFQKSNQNDIVRLRPNSSSGSSTLVEAQNSLFSKAVLNWQQLSNENKLLWNAFATAHPKIDYYGKSSNLSGYNWYVSLYISSQVLGSVPLIAPPTWSVVAQPPVPTGFFHSDIQSLYINWTPNYNHNNQSILCFLSFLKSSPKFTDQSNLFLTKILQGNFTHEYQFWTDYTSLFYDSPNLECTDTFSGGITLAFSAIDRTTFLSSPLTFCFFPHGTSTP